MPDDKLKTAFKIRQGRRSDLEAVVEITKRAWAGYAMAKLVEDRHGVIGNKPWHEYKVADVIVFWKDDRLEQTLVAEVKGKVVGYATCGLDDRTAFGTVGNNAVDPDYQGRGIGSAMQGKILEKMKEKGMKHARVTTFLHDKPARRVYEKQGFKEIARSIHYTMELQ